MSVCIVGMVCGFRCRMRRFPWFRLRIGIVAATDHRNGRMFMQEKEWLEEAEWPVGIENRMADGMVSDWTARLASMKTVDWMDVRGVMASWLMSLSPRWCCCGRAVHNDGRWLGVNCLPILDGCLFRHGAHHSPACMRCLSPLTWCMVGIMWNEWLSNHSYWFRKVASSRGLTRGMIIMWCYRTVCIVKGDCER